MIGSAKKMVISINVPDGSSDTDISNKYLHRVSQLRQCRPLILEYPRLLQYRK